LKALSYYPPRTSAIHGCNTKERARPGSGHRIVLTNPVRCCSAFAHTPISPTSLDSRCSALGPESEAPHNGQAIGSGQAAASIHRIHHSNEHPIGGANIGRFRIYMYRLLAPPSAHTIYRHRTRSGVRNYWHQGGAVLTAPLPTTPSERTRKIGPLQPEHARPPLIFAQSQAVFLRNVTKGR
jgi:hypothetical protein